MGVVRVGEGGGAGAAVDGWGGWVIDYGGHDDGSLRETALFSSLIARALLCFLF